MFLNEIDEKFLNEVKNEVDKAIDKVADKLGIDRAYYEFILKCIIVDESFDKVDEVILLDEEKEGKFCKFCGKFTRYCEERFGYICPECFRKKEGK